MYGLLPDNIPSIFLHNTAYERDGLRMWGRILNRYDPWGKDALFESVSTLYTLEQAVDKTISAHTSRARGLFSGLHGVTFNTMTNRLIILNSDCSCFVALSDRFCAIDPEVVNAYVEKLKNLLEEIKSRSRVLDGQSTPRPSALCGYAPH